MDKYKWILVILILLASVGILIFLKNKPSDIKENTTNIERIQKNQEAWCDNQNEVQDFEKPIPVVWTARLDGCLVSCQGASFTKTVDDGKYSRFAGYYPDTKGNYYSDEFNPIPEKFQIKGLVLKITGDWIGIQEDHPQTVFDGKCVPIVNIKEIEIVREHLTRLEPSKLVDFPDLMLNNDKYN